MALNKIVNGASVAMTALEEAAFEASRAPTKALLHEAVAKKRAAVTAAGYVYAFPDGSGTIQTRDETDLINVNGRVTAALVLTGMGVSDPVLDFRDEENVTHALTPAQMIAMGMAVSEFVSQMYAVKWTKDAEIDALSTAGQIAAYDVNAGWE